LICAEILSKDDSFASIVERLEDYLAMRVQNVWVIDPRLRRGYRYAANPELAVPLSALFD
jgi:hypothetical protein